MTIPNYIACFFAGLFLANAVPHFVKGVCGDAFPSPFAKPPGKGLSSPTVNVLWSLFNFVVGYVLFRAGKLSTGDTGALIVFFTGALIVFFAGVAAISIMLSINFATKHSS